MKTTAARWVLIAASQLFSFLAFSALAQDQTVNGSLNVSRTASDGAALVNINGGVSSTGYRLVAQNNGTNVFRVSPFGNLWLDIIGGSDGGLIVNNGGSGPAAIFTGGNVGIGNTAPQTPLHVTSTGAVVARFQSTNTLGPAVALYNGSAQIGVWSAYSAVSGSGTDMTPTLFSESGLGINFATGGSANRAMVITSAGNVGIGTTSPAYPLHVAGNIYSSAGVIGATLWTSDSVRKVNASSALSFRNSAGDPEMVLDASGNLGIGTDTPHARLDVNGQFLLSGQGNLITIAGKYNTSWTYDIRNDQTNALTIQSAYLQATPFAIDYAGNVGIGTISPQAKLDVVGGVRADIFQLNSAFFNYIQGTGQNLIVNGDDNIIFQTDNTVERMRISPGGNVGIGTASPSARLDVAGAANIQGNLSVSGSISAPSWTASNITGATNGLTLNGGGTGNQNIILTPTGAGGTVVRSNLEVQAGSNGQTGPVEALRIWGPNSPANSNSAQDLKWAFAAAGSAGIRSYRGGNYDTYLQFLTNPASGPGDNPQVRMHISENGNVGIGTTGPMAKLNVQGDGTYDIPQFIISGSSDTNKQLFFGYDTSLDIGFIQPIHQGAAYTNLIVNAHGGNVGIGTTAPTGKLHVEATGDANLRVSGVGAFGRANLILESPAGAWQIEDASAGTGNHPPGALGFTESGVGARMTLLRGGNVGIGTSAPAVRLDVAGDARISGTLTLGGQTFSPSNFVAAAGGTMTGALSTTSLTATTGSITGGSSGLRFTPGATNQSIVLDHTNPDGSAGTGRVEIRDALAITNTMGIQYLLMGNQNAGGTNHPAILRAANGSVEFGSGDSWSGQGGNFTSRITFHDSGNVGIGTINPEARLHVVGNVRLNNLDVFTTVGGGNNRLITFQPDDSSSVNTSYIFNANPGGGAYGTFTVNSAGSPRVHFGLESLAGNSFINVPGNLGIGTTSPSERLAIAGNLHLATGDPTIFWDSNYLNLRTKTASIPVVALRGSAVGGYAPRLDMYNGADNTVVNSINANGASYIMGGNVGVGTTNPQAKLDVAGTIIADSGTDRPITLGGNVGSIVLQGDPGGWAFGLHARGSAGTMRGGFGFLGGADAVSYYYIGDGYANPTMAIGPGNGNVGIGTTNPGAKLEVNGTAKINGYFTAQSGAQLNGLASMQTAAVSGVSSFGGTMTFVSSGNPAAGSLGWGTSATDPLSLVAGTNRSLFLASGANTSPAAGMTISSAGNVGIGTANPLARMQIDHVSAATVPFTVGNQEALRLQNSDATANNFTEILFSNSIGGASAAIAAQHNTHAGQNGDLLFATGGGMLTEKLRITATGNVGIGTTTPSAKLEVAGDTKVTATTASTNAATGALTVAGGTGVGGNLNVGGTATIGSGGSATKISSSGITTGGSVTATSYVSTTGSVAGSSTSNGLTLNAGAANQNVTLAATGTGNVVSSGNFVAQGKLTANNDVVVNGRLGVGGPALVAKSEIRGGGLMLSPQGVNQWWGWVFRPNDPSIWVQNQGDHVRTELHTASSNAQRAIYSGSVVSGTLDNPQATLEGSGLQLRFVGHDGSQFYPGATIDLTADASASASQHATSIRFATYGGGETMRITADGKVGIGTITPGNFKLAVSGPVSVQQQLNVNGTVYAKEVIVQATLPPPDYVFDDDYRNAPLSEVEAHIKAEKHLPGVPSAKEIVEKGINVAEMQTVLLKKVEELTLHMIEMDKENKRLKERLAQLEATVK